MESTSRLFVQDLPPHCDESALRKHFREYGVTDVQIPRRKADKKSRAALRSWAWKAPTRRRKP